MFTSIHHTSFTVSDIDRSIAFYRDVLGMELVVEREVAGDYLADLMGYADLHLRLVFLRTGTNQVELIQYLRPQGRPVDPAKCNPGTAHICFLVDDLQAVYRQLVAKGVRTEGSPVPIVKGPNKGGYAVFIYDPDGIALELLQLPKQAPQAVSS